MTPLVVDDGVGGERQIEAAEFPLAIGGSTCDIALPGVQTSEPLAFLGLEDGELFVQPGDVVLGDSEVQLLCNGAPLAASQWLHEGDVLAAGSSVVVVHERGRGVRLQVRAARHKEETDPPRLIGGGSSRPAAEPTSITPVDFTPAALRGGGRVRRRVRPLVAVAWVVVVAAAATAWFVLTARSVEVEIDPSPDQMAIRTDLVAPRFGGRYLLRPGTHVVVAEKEGYQSLEATIEVSREPHQTFRFALDKLPGLLSVSTGRVQGAEVLIDGEVVGTTPLAGVEVAAGEHEVTVRAARHRVLSTRVVIDGAGAAQALEAKLEPAWAAITFRSSPSGAVVAVDGARVGVTPLTTDIGAGAHTVQLALAGHKPYGDRLEVVAGEPLTLPVVQLKPSDGRVALSSEPEGANVMVDGAFAGVTPVELRLTSESAHEIKVSKAGYETLTQRVEVSADESLPLTVTLDAVYGELEVSSTPPNAALYVDGTARGMTGQTLRLVAIEHAIEVRKEGYETYRTTVSPRPGLNQALRVTLQSTQSTKALPAVIHSPQGVELRLIPAGRFRMGASRREPGRRANETLREVELTRPFYIAGREVSNREFREFRSEHLSGAAGRHNLEIDHHPVVQVTWEDAARYCNWLSAKESLPPVYVERRGKLVARSPLTAGYRLPTEAEWVWAARYGGGEGALKYVWGSSLPVPPGAGNFGDQSAQTLLGDVIPDYDDSFPVTAPVGSFSANARGLFNMGGNVAEWVHDVYSIHLPSAETVDKDPSGPGGGEYHVIRGAGWMDDRVTELRLSRRDYGDQPRPDVGFRIARGVVVR